MIKERCWFSQINFFIKYFPHRFNVLFLSNQFDVIHIHRRKNFFHGVRISIPNWNPSSKRTSIGFSQSAFPVTVLPKDDNTDFAQEERLGLPYWTMILAICVVVDESKCLDILVLELSIIVEHLPFLPGYKQIVHPLPDLRTLAVRKWYPWLLPLSFVMLMILVLWIMHKTLNRLSQCHLGVQLDLCIFGALSPIQHFSNDICPSVRRNELLRPSSLLHRSPLSYFWLSSGSTPKSFPIFPVLIHCCLCCKNFHGLEHRNKFVYQIEMLQWIVPFSCNMVFTMIRQRFSHTQSCRFTGFQNKRKFWFDVIGFTMSHPMLDCSCWFCKT